MPSLNFKGKALVQNFHLLVPFHEPRPVKANSETARITVPRRLVAYHGDLSPPDLISRDEIQLVGFWDSQ